MKIYTKRGDAGQTSLIGGARVPKHHIRIEAYGTVDELNACMGLLSEQPACATQRDFLRRIQDRLFVIGSNLANDPEKSQMKLAGLAPDDIAALEHSIDEMEQELPPLRNFVLPGGHPANAVAHLARCVCRRAERVCVHLSETAPVEPQLVAYLNRLSDWLFVFARYISHQQGAEEIVWKAG